MRVAIDTSILVYAEGMNGVERQAQANAVIARLDLAEVVLPVQVLWELFAVQIRKGKMSAQTAKANVSRWARAYTTIDTSADILAAAMELVGRHRIAVWDAVVIAAAAAAGCRELLSEDMQDGFVWRGVTVRNPIPALPRA